MRGVELCRYTELPRLGFGADMASLTGGQHSLGGVARDLTIAGFPISRPLETSPRPSSASIQAVSPSSCRP